MNPAQAEAWASWSALQAAGCLAVATLRNEGVLVLQASSGAAGDGPPAEFVRHEGMSGQKYKVRLSTNSLRPFPLRDTLKSAAGGLTAASAISAQTESVCIGPSELEVLSRRFCPTSRLRAARRGLPLHEADFASQLLR